MLTVASVLLFGAAGVLCLVATLLRERDVAEAGAISGGSRDLRIVVAGALVVTVAAAVVTALRFIDVAL